MNRSTAALLATIFTLACGEPPPTIPMPPTACGTVENIEFNIRDRETVQPCFSDPEMATLTLSTTSSDSAVVFSHVSGSDVVVTGRSIGEATITIIATDPDSLTATIAFMVNVLGYPLYLDDDFSEDAGNFTYGDGVLFHDDVVSIWSTNTGSGENLAHHRLDETTTWRVNTHATFSHDSILTNIQVRALSSTDRYQGWSILLGDFDVTDGTTNYPTNWAAAVYDAQGTGGSGWYIYEYDWFGEHSDVIQGEFVEIEIAGIETDEVVFRLNGDILATFTEETTPAGIELIEIGLWAYSGFRGPDRCPNDVCIDAQFDWIQVRGLQGEERSTHSRIQSDRTRTPLTWKVRR